MVHPVIINERDGTRFEQAPGDTLLRAALRAGVGLSYECNSGGCGGSCWTKRAIKSTSSCVNSPDVPQFGMPAGEP